MQNWPSWIPTPRFWVNAIALILLINGLQHAFAYLGIIIILLINFLPKFIFVKLIYLFSLVAQLSPIPAVAFVHHWLHRFLDRFFPESRIPETESAPGVFPGLISWWEGLYGWLVNILSTVIVFGILGLFLPSPDLFHFLNFFKAEGPPVLTISTLFEVIIAAYLYQFEYLVHQHLIAAARQ
ncbi:MAG: hypothetical protein RMX96_01275 [Nostoc sp. ChiSLP02]|nr:hypothetical protein [Nostoc sp. DedSLP05]MDZ8102963.1 hypothetical protein [Nostoc sp. DedSLP01]MDZ8183480.1 hypothetical protein [Nostoc sp. ChiSLP02]